MLRMYWLRIGMLIPNSKMFFQESLCWAMYNKILNH